MAKKNPSTPSNLKSKISNSQSLRVLIVEDSEDDALLEIIALKKGGYFPVYERVETTAAMRKALREQTWEVILCDYRMPHFNAVQAISLYKEANIDIPLIIVSGAIGEETAVECMRLGAHDYIMKGNLPRLIPAIERELKEAESRVQRKRAEQELRESEERYKALFDRSLDLVYIFDFEGRFIDANDAALNRFGYTREEIHTLNFASLLSEDQLPLAFKTLQEIRETGIQKSLIEFRLRHKDGSDMYVETQGSTIMSNGIPVAIQAIARDITERKLTAQTLQDSELRFKELFENMSNCVAIYKAADDGEDFIINAFNQSAEQTEQIDRKDIIGKSVLDVFPGVRDMGLWDVLQRVWHTGQSEHIPAAYYKDARVEGWRENYVYKLPTGEVVTLYKDITERKRAEIRLFESEEKYRMLVENGSEAIFIAQDAMLKFANRASFAMFGFSNEALTSLPFIEFIHPEDREMVLGSHLRRLRGETVPSIYTFRIVTREGIIKWVEIHSTIIHWQGKPATLNFLTDITERKRMDELLKNSETQYRTFINATADMVFVKDEQFRHIIANQVMAAFFGKDQADIIGKTDFELMPEHAALDCQASDRQAIRTQSVVITAQQISGRMYETTKFPVPLQSDKTGVGGIIRDVTERKQAEEKLALNFETEAAMHALLGLSLEGRTVKEFLESALDLVLSLQWLAIESKGAIFLADKEGEKLHLHVQKGFSKELCAMCSTVPFGHCLCGRAAAARAVQFADRVDEHHDTRYEGMPPHGHYCVPILSGDHILGVIVLYVKEGHIRSPWEEDFLKAVANSLAGTIERRRAEEALKERENKYRLLADNVNDVIFVLDMNLKYTYISPSVKTLRGYEPAEVMKLSAVETLTPASWDLAVRTLSEEIELEKSEHREIPMSRTLQLEMRRKDGTTVWTEVKLSFIRDENQQPVSILGLTRDITERKRTEEKIKIQLAELQSWQDVMLGREDRVQELKHEVNELCRRLGKLVRYPSQEPVSTDSETEVPKS